MFRILMFLGVILMTTNLNAKETGTFNYQLGDFKVTALINQTMEHNKSLFRSDNPETLQKALNVKGFNKSSSNGFLVDTGEHKVLFDAGMSGITLTRLKEEGVDPEDIDIICLTHMHFDHIGGLLNADGTKAFPNAAIYVSKEELAANQDAGFLKAYKGQIKPFEKDAQIVKGILSEADFGHTNGHSIYWVYSKGRKMLIWGDVIHAAVQFEYPEVYLTYDSDYKKAIAFRKALLEKAAEENAIVAGMHLVFPGMGTITKQQTGYSFETLK